LRLREIQLILENAVKKDIPLKVELGQPGLVNISNINKFKKFFSGIYTIPIFSEQVQFLKNTALFATSLDGLEVRRDEGETISQVAFYLTNASQALLKVLNVMLTAQEENTVSILLPNPSNFRSVIEFLDEFEKAISQVIVNKTIQGNLKIKSWESGSFWVEVFLGAQAAVFLVAGIAWSAAVISKKNAEAALIEQHVRSLEIKNESLSDILEKQKIATSLLLENETKQLLVKHFNKESDPEMTERLKYAIKTFAELIQKGAEIHPALNAPEQVSNLFPDFKNLDSIISQVKQIESGKKADGGGQTKSQS
jgi:hypothetical protein